MISGFSKNASILPHRNSIFFLVIGFFNALSSLGFLINIVNKMKKQVLTLKDGHLVNYKQKGTYNNESA